MNNEGIVVFHHTIFEEKICFLWQTRDKGACNTKTVSLDEKSNRSTLVPNNEEVNWSLINLKGFICQTAKAQGDNSYFTHELIYNHIACA